MVVYFFSCYCFFYSRSSILISWTFFYTNRALNTANASDMKNTFLDLYLSISNGFVSSKMYDKRYDFDFNKVYFPF